MSHLIDISPENQEIVGELESAVSFRTMKSHGPSSDQSPPLRRSYIVRSVARAASILKAFSSTHETLTLQAIAQSTHLDKGTAFRLLETLIDAGIVSRRGDEGYRSCFRPLPARRFRIGYASQSSLLPFTGLVSEGLLSAASAADLDLIVVNNQFSPRIALENAERFVLEKVDLVIDSQINLNVASQIGTKFNDAGIPFIAVDIPHPGCFYFGADNYKAGLIAGRHLARWALKNWGGQAEQLMFLGVDAAGPLLNIRLKGICEGLRELIPESKNVPACHYDTKGGRFDATLEAVRKHLRRRKVRRVLVGAVNDSCALAALQAFREAGLETETAIVGQDGGIEAREELRRHRTRLIGTVAYFPEGYGARLIKLAIEILERKPVPPATFTQHELITSANVDKVYPNDSWMRSTASHR